MPKEDSVGFSAWEIWKHWCLGPRYPIVFWERTIQKTQSIPSNIAVPLSPEELKAQREDIIQKMEKGLLGHTEAIMELYDLTEEEAIEKT